MAKGPLTRIPFRRRREQRTNYRIRKGLLKSRKARLVIRVSNRYTRAQICVPEIGGDKTNVSVSSKDLVHFGWLCSWGSIPAAYLTGYLAGKQAKASGFEELILDIGTASPFRGSRVYAALKGTVDSGVNVPHGDEDIFPDESRVRGEHIANYAEALKKEDTVEYNFRFAEILSYGSKPEGIPKLFDIVLAAIEKNPTFTAKTSAVLSKAKRKKTAVKIPERLEQRYKYEPVAAYVDPKRKKGKPARVVAKPKPVETPETEPVVVAKAKVEAKMPIKASEAEAIAEEIVKEPVAAPKPKAKAAPKPKAKAATKPKAKAATKPKAKAADPEKEAEAAGEVSYASELDPHADVSNLPVDAIEGLGKTYKARLNGAGINTIAEVAELSIEKLIEISKAPRARAAKWNAIARFSMMDGISQEDAECIVLGGNISSDVSLMAANPADLVVAIKKQISQGKVKVPEGYSVDETRANAWIDIAKRARREVE